MMCMYTILATSSIFQAKLYNQKYSKGRKLGRKYCYSIRTGSINKLTWLLTHNVTKNHLWSKIQESFLSFFMLLVASSIFTHSQSRSLAHVLVHSFSLSLSSYIIVLLSYTFIFSLILFTCQTWALCMLFSKPIYTKQ